MQQVLLWKTSHVSIVYSGIVTEVTDNNNRSSFEMTSTVYKNELLRQSSSCCSAKNIMCPSIERNCETSELCKLTVFNTRGGECAGLAAIISSSILGENYLKCLTNDLARAHKRVSFSKKTRSPVLDVKFWDRTYCKINQSSVLTTPARVIESYCIRLVVFYSWTFHRPCNIWICSWITFVVRNLILESLISSCVPWTHLHGFINNVFPIIDFNFS